MRVQGNLKYIYKSHFKLWPRLKTIKHISIGISLQIFQLSCSLGTELYFQIFQDWKVFKIILYFLQSRYNLKTQLCFNSQVLSDKRNERRLLQEQAFITHISTHALGAVSRVQEARFQKDRMVLWMISMDSRISSSLMTRGGARRMMSPCVGLASSPLSRSRRHTFQAS